MENPCDAAEDITPTLASICLQNKARYEEGPTSLTEADEADLITHSQLVQNASQRAQPIYSKQSARKP